MTEPAKKLEDLRIRTGSLVSTHGATPDTHRRATPADIISVMVNDLEGETEWRCTVHEEPITMFAGIVPLRCSLWQAGTPCVPGRYLILRLGDTDTDWPEIDWEVGT